MQPCLQSVITSIPQMFGALVENRYNFFCTAREGWTLVRGETLRALEMNQIL